MPASKAQQKAVAKYMMANYDEIKVRVSKGQKDTIQAHAAARGESVNGFIGRAISATMERDSSAERPQEPAEGPKTGFSCSGGILVPPETEKAAQSAAKATGESVPEYLARAVSDTARRDSMALKMGVNPVTGKPMERDG